MIKIHIDQKLAIDAYDIYIVNQGYQYQARLRYTAKGEEWVEFKEGERDIPPTLTLRKETAYELAKALNQLGIKPESEHKLQGVLEATKEHLADMRELVFTKPPKGKE